MSIKPGRYFIHSAADSNHFAGTGPVPPIYPPYPAPLRSVGSYTKDLFEVKSKGGDSYIVETHGLPVGYDEDNNVKLLPIGKKSVVWAVDHADGLDLVRIKLSDADKCWTASGKDDYAPIRLEGNKGEKTQEWKLVPYNDY